MIRRVLIDGEPVEVNLESEVSVVEVEPGVFSVIRKGRSYEVRAGEGAMWIDGERFEVEVVDPRAMKRGGDSAVASGQQTLKAAMPGKVVRVLASVGDEVEAGQGIVVIEAMKMQNEVKAPAAGKVLSIAVREGTAVAGGDTIAVIG